jgi:hypothetical protein
MPDILKSDIILGINAGEVATLVEKTQSNHQQVNYLIETF